MSFFLKSTAAGLLGAALLLAAAPAATQAQGVFDLGTLTNTLTIPTKSGKATTARPAGQTSLPYTPTAALKARTVQGYVDRLKTKNPAYRQGVAAMFKNQYGLDFSQLAIAPSGFAKK